MSAITTLTDLILRDEAEALVQFSQCHEIAVDQVYHRLDDAVPLARFDVTHLGWDMA